MTTHTADAAETPLTTDPSRGPGQVRRIVTGHDAQGNSIVSSDDDAPNVFRSSTVPTLGSAVAWATPPDGASNDGNTDAAGADDDIDMFPAPGGTIFRVADFPPDDDYVSNHDSDGMFDEMGGPDAKIADKPGTNRHFWFHKTDSLDYAIVIEGEIWLILDNEECLVRAGDVIVQRGTSHAWANRSGKRCRIGFVLIGTPPIETPASGALGSPDTDVRE